MSVGDKSLTLAPVPYYDMSEADEIGKSVLSGESIPKSVYDKAMKRWEEELERLAGLAKSKDLHVLAKFIEQNFL